MHADASYLTNGYLDTVINWIPGMEGFRLKDLPSFIRTTDPDDFMVNFIIGEIENARYASAVIFNTLDELEHQVLKHLVQSFQIQCSTLALFSCYFNIRSRKMV
ncbi:UDP-glucuronosyltransferase, putative [Ricinus communis]|uniref:UDP-glucuronosyltransferase, putative n=1 Tax=Ricinus communis TaxID=3988 RepID=B9TQ04_RICCO|nr:UDP-glucuronosyltransferase, putative [Ricinus communis]